MDHSEHAASVFNKYAVSYEERFMDVSMYSKSLDCLINNLAPTQLKVLDVACGPANISKYLLDRNSAIEIAGIDLSENMISLAKKNIPTGNFQLKDARDILSLNLKYDLIISGFCFPYLTKIEVIQFISDASKCLNAGGYLYLSTMEKPYSTSGLQKGSKGDEIMMHFHEEEYLSATMNANGFSTIYIDRVVTTNTVGEEVVDLCMVGRFN